jgi:hypothetical protein
MANYEGLDSVTTWKEIRFFDAESVIHRIKSRRATEDNTELSNIVVNQKSRRRYAGSQQHYMSQNTLNSAYQSGDEE